MSEENVKVLFGADVEGLMGGISKAQQGLEGLSGPIGTVAGHFKELASVIVSAFAFDKIKDMAEHFGEMGEKVEVASKQLGIAADKLQLFQSAQAFSGGTAEGATQSFTKLNRNMEEAIKKAGPAREAFQQIGISVSQLKASSPDQIIEKIAQAYGETADGADKTANAMALMGRGGAQMIAMLDKGKEGMEEFKQKMKDTGAIMSDDMVARFAESKESVEFFDKSVEGLGITMFDALRPAIDEIISGTTDLIQGINKSISKGGEWYDVITGLIAILDALVIGLDAVIQAIRTLYDITVLAIEVMITEWETLGKVMLDVLSGNWSQIGPDYDAGMEKIKTKTAETIKEIEDHWQKFGERAGKTAGDIARRIDPDAGPSSTKTPKPRIGTGTDTGTANAAAKERQQMETEEVAFEAKMAKLKLDNYRNTLDAEVALGRITEEQKIEMLMKAQQRESAIEYQALVRQGQIAGLSKLQKQKIENEKLLVVQKYLNAETKLQQQAAIQQQKIWRSVFAAIDNAMKTSLQGVLMGTQTIGQAVQNMAINVASSLVGMLEEQAAKWLENKILGMVTAKEEGMAIIQAHAAEGGAAAYASTAAIPIVGPSLAPAAAALAQTNILAMMATLPSYDVGSMNIPQDQIAKVHKGEIIVPAAQAQAIRDSMNGGGSSGGGAQIHIHATDAQSVARLLKNNADVVAQIVRSSSRNFNPNVPSWKG